MKEEELIRRLLNTDTPDLDLPLNRQQLKTSLMEEGYSQRKQGVPALLQKGEDMITAGLFSRQPVWKAAAIGTFCIAFAVVLSLMLPSMHSDSVYARAMNFMTSNPDIRAILGSENRTDDLYKILVLDSDEAVPVRRDIEFTFTAGNTDIESESYVITFPVDDTLSESSDGDDIYKPDNIIVTFPAGTKFTGNETGMVSDKYSVVELTTTFEDESWVIYLVLDTDQMKGLDK